jgi:hypothetical protein
MTATRTLIGWSGLALIAGGVAIALFVLVHPQGEFNADVIRGGQAILAHNFHFVGAALTAFGLGGLLLDQLDRGKRFGATATLVAFFGTVWFAGLGLLSFAALPFIAAHTPALVAPDGAFWNEPPQPLFLVGLGFFAVGYIALGAAILRDGGLPRWSGALLIAGAVLTIPPPVVVPTVLILTAGGVLLGAGLAWLGYGLRKSSPQ